LQLKKFPIIWMRSDKIASANRFSPNTINKLAWKAEFHMWRACRQTKIYITRFVPAYYRFFILETRVRSMEILCVQTWYNPHVVISRIALNETSETRKYAVSSTRPSNALREREICIRRFESISSFHIIANITSGEEAYDCVHTCTPFAYARMSVYVSRVIEYIHVHSRVRAYRRTVAGVADTYADT